MIILGVAEIAGLVKVLENYLGTCQSSHPE